jgi:hypothetical protein
MIGEVPADLEAPAMTTSIPTSCILARRLLTLPHSLAHQLPQLQRAADGGGLLKVRRTLSPDKPCLLQQRRWQLQPSERVPAAATPAAGMPPPLTPPATG